jgi:hypothetical protein
VATSHLSRYLAGTFALCCLSAMALVSCGGSNATMASNGSTTTPATATACAQLRARARPVTGTIQSVSGQTVHITESNGGSVNATYSDTTRITQQKLITESQATSVLQQGANVTIQVQQNSNGTYTATSISLIQGGQGQNGAVQGGQGGTRAGQGRGQGNNTACFGGGQGRGRGTGNGNGSGQGNGQGGRSLFGTIWQINGNTLTVMDRQQNSYTITLASDTKIIQTTSVSTSNASSVLQTGMGIRVMGQNANGVITATSMSIYPPGLLPNPMPTPSNP